MNRSQKTEHTFHIPVMGIAFTIDTPIKVARFGISSVISIVEDRLIEMMRKHYYPLINKEYIPITTHEPDYRAKRITDYLNLVNTIVQDQVSKIKSEAFEKGSEIVKYFEMLPETSSLKKTYIRMLNTKDENEMLEQQAFLRQQIKPGSIDVNIMTKVDRDRTDALNNPIPDGSEAVAALRGYAESNLTNSSVVFSAGMNPRLFAYTENLDAFLPDSNFEFSKKVTIKVSDFRSALIQGKFLAKKGIWVSEFRVESGLNCGGHAFATDGYLLGPILEEFKVKRLELVNALFETYQTAIQNKLNIQFPYAPNLDITVQGGIGTFAEDEFLLKEYDLTRTGWGTPFLLVQEATTVDMPTLELLSAAKENDIELSHNSPLGVRFHYLKNTTSDKEKQFRILSGKPGSPCTEKHLAFNTEFTEEPVCTASKKYQNLKLQHLKTLALNEDELKLQEHEVLSKECLCIGLSNAAAINYNETFVKNFNSTTICPGPNIVNFNKTVSLQTMTDHIYGRTNIMHNLQRPHMFVAEIILYINYLKEQLYKNSAYELDAKSKKYFQQFISNLKNGIQYYQDLAQKHFDQLSILFKTFESIKIDLRKLQIEFNLVPLELSLQNEYA
ncbi:MAG TPA: hypothetical protein PLU17_02160 [Chitinophagaceae bacterium]|nr:hypothetical protein [Chitinophagaceae bacterium]